MLVSAILISVLYYSQAIALSESDEDLHDEDMKTLLMFFEVDELIEDSQSLSEIDTIEFRQIFIQLTLAAGSGLLHRPGQF
jgi:hypothetical protein